MYVVVHVCFYVCVHVYIDIYMCKYNGFQEDGTWMQDDVRWLSFSLRFGIAGLSCSSFPAPAACVYIYICTCILI